MTETEVLFDRLEADLTQQVPLLTWHVDVDERFPDLANVRTELFVGRKLLRIAMPFTMSLLDEAVGYDIILNKIVEDVPITIGDAIRQWRPEVFKLELAYEAELGLPEETIACTCAPDCPPDCKGECGCQYHDDLYQDFLSRPDT